MAAIVFPKKLKRRDLADFVLFAVKCCFRSYIGQTPRPLIGYDISYIVNIAALLGAFKRKTSLNTYYFLWIEHPRTCNRTSHPEF